MRSPTAHAKAIPHQMMLPSRNPMNISRRQLIQTASLALLHRHTRAFAADAPLIESIEKAVLPAPAMKGGTWFHPRACMAGKTAFMTLQTIKGSDYFGPVHWTTSEDLGRTWREFQPAPPLGWVPLPEGGNEGVCDVTPEFHPATGSVLALGHSVLYKDAYFDPAQPPRRPSTPHRSATVRVGRGRSARSCKRHCARARARCRSADETPA